MTIEVEELAGSPKVQFTRTGGSASRSVKMAWADRYNFLLQVMPSSTLSGTDIEIPPTESFPGVPFLYVDKVNLEPMFPEDPLGDGVFPAAYTHARADIDYSTFKYETSETGDQSDGPGGAQGLGENAAKTFVTIDVDYSGQYLTWPSSSLSWEQPSDIEDDGKGSTKVPEDAKVSIVTPTIEYNASWNYVPFPPWFAMRLATGAVNAYEFLGSPPETLLFLGGKANREITNEGLRSWTLKFKFVEKNNNPFDATDPFGWNHFLRTDGPRQGTFMRMNRRPIGGSGRNKVHMNGGDTELTLTNRETFPAQNPGGEMHCVVGKTQEIIRVSQTTPQATETWTIVRGQKGTLAQSIEVNDTVTQIFCTTLDLGLIPGDLVAFIEDETQFPSLGQFFIKIGDGANAEVACVVRRFPGTNTLGILRGIRGETEKTHAAGTVVRMLYMPIYPLWNFSTLFLSGLVTG